MHQAYIDPFMQAGRDVLAMVTGAPVSCGTVAPAGRPLTPERVSIVVGVNGALQGQVILSMTDATATGIAGLMLGMDAPEFDEMAASAVSELGNMIAGNAAVLLGQSKLHCDLTPPTIIFGADVHIALRVPALMAPLTLPLGVVEIAVSLTEA